MSKNNFINAAIVFFAAFVCLSSGTKSETIVKQNDTQINYSSCTWKEFKMYGKIQVVDAFPDVKVQIVDAFPDLKVQVVDAFPDDCGKWKFVDAFPDTKIQFVTAFPDVKIQYVDAFPGKP